MISELWKRYGVWAVVLASIIAVWTGPEKLSLLLFGAAFGMILARL